MMLRTVTRLTPTFAIPIFRDERNEYDIIKLEQNLPEVPITGLDRVKKMFQRNEYDEVSLELHNVIQSSLCGAFVGAGVGGFVQSRLAYINFIENNQATIFKSTMQAKKKLQDQVTVAFARGAYQWGWRLGIFTGFFSLVSTTVSVYRGNTSLIEYISAGAITGAMYKAHLGLAATLVGAGLGAALSTIAGLAILGILKATGVTMDEIRKALYSIKEAREDQYKEAVEKASTIKNDNLTRHHEMLIEERGQQSIEEI